MAFVETRWSLIARAGFDSEAGRDALNSLCKAYSRALLEFLRRSGYDPHKAEELLQSFFLKLVEGNFVRAADQSKGRFRNFILKALRSSVANDLRNQSRIKRGGKVDFLPLEDDVAELVVLPPDRQFDREWALHVLRQAIDELELKYRLDGKADLFASLESSLSREWDSEDRESTCKKLDVSRSHLRVLLSRLRADFRTALKRTVLDTILDPNEVDNEIQDLMTALSGR